MANSRKQADNEFPEEMFLAVQHWADVGDGEYREERIYYSEKALRKALPGYFDMTKPFEVYKLVPDEDWKFKNDSTN